MTRWEVRLIVAAAFVLAIAYALLLTGVARSLPTPRPLVPMLLKGLAVTLLLQGGLLFAPVARGRWRWLAALLMVPCLLLLLGHAGEEVTRIVRGRGFRPGTGLLAFGGVAVYLWALWRMARQKRE